MVADVRRVLEGHGDDLDERLRERQQVLVKALAFEQAGRLQNQREALGRALRGVRRLRAAGRDDVVLVYAARRRGWVALWGVRGGRVAVEREVGRDAFGEQAAHGLLAELAAAEPPRPPLPAAAIDEMLLVHSWTEAHRASPNLVDLSGFLSGDEDAASVAAGLVRTARLAASDAAGPVAGQTDAATSAIASHPAPARPIAP